MSEMQSRMALQVIFGIVMILFGMLMLSASSSGNTYLLFVAIALLCFRDGLIQLIEPVLQAVQK